ncbi:retinol dehydrogenase 8 isoform X2 [Strongylocentrotus purpuratus]|uniref:Ketoreductase domain-containing protein n=1 Tax=Strongylocentrotus purpuratus TaxID=7668 RepID=A0A7M7NR22_STRPU|nr:retinol dehydrogenase 8 isoform X2 [Strongylocentrotus purpuratus]
MGSRTKEFANYSKLSRIEEEIGKFRNGAVKRKKVTAHAQNGGEIQSSEKKTSRSSPQAFHAPDGGYGWFILLAAHCTLIFREGIAKCLGVFLPTFRSYFDVSTSLIGWISSICVTFADFTGLISGPLCRRFGCKPVAMVGGFFAGLGLTLAAFTVEVSQLAICLAISVSYQAFDMAPKITLITGCSSGIGLATAVKLAREAAKGYVVYATMRNLDKRSELEKAAGQELNSTLFVLELDVTKHDTITAAVNTVIEKHGRLDILVNNSGIGSYGLLEDTTFEQIRRVMETNFFGAVRMTQEVIPIMKKQRSGRIINISSTTGIFGIPYMEIYCASKYALEGFSESLAATLRPYNIWVSTIQPGPVHSKFGENLAVNDLPTFDFALQLDPSDPVRRSVEKCSSVLRKGFDNPQEPGDIADVIHRAITDDRPHFQYPTSQFRAQYAAKKFVDPSNDAMVEYFADACTP